MGSNITNMSGREAEGSYKIQLRKAGDVAISTHDGSELQPMIVAVLRQVSGAAAKALADDIEALTVVAQPNFDSDARRNWTIEYARRGVFVATVSTRLSNGEDKLTGDFGKDTFSNVKEALVWVLAELGGIVFSAQVAAL